MLGYIRRLPCRMERLFREASILPKFSYFNPSSAYPYVYVRAMEKMEDTTTSNLLQISHMFLYSYLTDRMIMMDIPSGVLRPSYNFYQGIEDTRILMHKNRLWFVSTSTHVSASMRSEMMIGFFNQDVSAIEFVQHLDFGVRPLKNICPFVHKGMLLLIDAYTLTIYAPEVNEAGMHTPRVWKRLELCNGLSKHTMRGSTSPVLLHGNLYGCVVHEHIPKTSGGALAYVSYWMEFDVERGMVTFVSSPFFVSCLGIEFISGIEYKPESGVVELYLGFQDKVPIVAYTTLHDLRAG